MCYQFLLDKKGIYEIGNNVSPTLVAKNAWAILFHEKKPFKNVHKCCLEKNIYHQVKILNDIEFTNVQVLEKVSF